MAMYEVPSDCRLVMRKIRRTVPLESLDLPDEFFPAHLSVALVNAVFPARDGPDARAGWAAERYCRRLGIAHHPDGSLGAASGRRAGHTLLDLIRAR